MALAPVAVLVLLFGDSGGALRAAVALAVITIVLLAVSMAIRPSVDMLRVDIEHRVLDEMERIRLRAQNENAMAVRHTQRALTDHIHALNETISDLRAQVDEVQAVAYFEPPAHQAIGPGPAAAGPGVRRTETVHVTRRTTYDDTGTVYGSRSAQDAARAVEGEWIEDDRGWSPSQPDQRALPVGHESYEDDSYRDRRDDRDRYDDRDRGRYDRDSRGGYDRDRDRGYERDRYEDRRQEDRYDERRYDDRRYDSRRPEEPRQDDQRYDDRRHDDRRYDDRRYDDRRYDDRRHDDRRYDDRRYDDRGRAPRQRSDW
jgi:hypothetical protein